MPRTTDHLATQNVNGVESTAFDIVFRGRHAVTHNRGTETIEAGNIRFGLEMRSVGRDRDIAIHVLGDVAGQEIESLAFDCFRIFPILSLRTAE
jgi:hypothetical protein